MLVPSGTRAEVLDAYLAGLADSGVEAVVLHSHADLPGPDGHDIDIATSTGGLERALALQAEVAARCGWQLVQRLQHERTAYYSVLASIADPRQTLKLDLCSHYMARGRRILDAAALLDGSRAAAGVRVPAPRHEFAYLLAKAFIKAKPAPAVLPHLAELHAADAPGCDAELASLTDLQNLPQLAAAAGDDPAFFAAGRAGFLGRWRVRPGDRLAEWRRRLRRLLRPSGVMLAVLGPDGAGKSTVISALESGLAPFFRRYRYLHFRPGFRAAAEDKPGRPMVTEPHGQLPRSLPASWLKVAYYAADYLFSYVAILRRHLACSTLIVFDRYYQDLLVDPRRFRLRGSGWLVRLLGPLIPRPMLYLVLDAEPAAIHARKPELPIDELARQREIFRNFAAREGRALLISTDGDEAATVAAALKQVVGAIAQREAGR